MNYFKKTWTPTKKSASILTKMELRVSRKQNCQIYN